MFWIACYSAFILVAVYIGYRWHTDKNLPPGPWGLPILGSVLRINSHRPYKSFTKFARKYGPIYSIQMGKHMAVVLSDPTSIRMILAQNELADRTNFEVVNEIMQEHGTD